MTFRHHIAFAIASGRAFAVALSLMLIMILPAQASSIAESYRSNETIATGSLVSLDEVSPPTVTLASLQNNSYLVGVAEDPDDTLLSIYYDESQVSVALEGEVTAYVSDLNGNIEAGDFIGTSWIAGVGMKANSDERQKILGIALENFSPGANTRIVGGIETSEGTADASIGTIAIRLFDRDVGPDVSSQLGAIESFATKIAGKNVPLARAILSGILFSISLIISGAFLANAIRASFISIGRNPLSGSSIFSSLMQVSGVSILLMVLGSVLAYVVLVV